MNNTNEVILTGKIITKILKDYTYKGTDYYKFYIGVPRLSGVIDELPVIVSNSLLLERGAKLKKGDNVTILGEYRSFSDVVNGNKLILYVYVKEINRIAEDEAPKSNNKVLMDGFVRKMGELRVSPKGKKVVDVLIAVNKHNKSSYIPCIIWNWNENAAKNIKVGDEIYITGRIQSREYSKVYDEENSETKVAYEVSVSKFGIIK